MSTGEFTQAACWGGRPVARKIADVVPRGRVVVTGELGRRSVAGLAVGTRCTVEGTARMEDGRLVVWNPLYRIEPAQPEQGAESEKPPR